MPFDLIDPEKPDPTLKLLTGAHDFLSDKSHWCQGSYQNFNGARCAIGALCLAAKTDRGKEPSPIVLRGHEIGSQAIQMLARAIPRGCAGYSTKLTSSMDAVISYNDLAVRTHADVLKLFNKAISLRVKQLTAALAA